MTVEDVQKCSTKIVEEYSGDDEYQHVEEDRLHIEFIRWVVSYGTPEQREIAAAILKIQDLDFARWCA